MKNQVLLILNWIVCFKPALIYAYIYIHTQVLKVCASMLGFGFSMAENQLFTKSLSEDDVVGCVLKPEHLSISLEFANFASAY